jgi:2-polyprenyl-3-methyl-5-hydroxy-6-metoxy-1,4-benzoquinol methylase
MGSETAPVAAHDASTGWEAELPPENVFGHTYKVLLFREACAGQRAGRHGLRILDLGCGSGYAVTRFLGGPDDEILGLDLYAPNVQYAKEHFERQGLTFECRSTTSLSQSRRTFDVVVLADVLEHLEDPLSVLKECRRLLAADGMLLVTIPNGHGPFEIESAVSRVPVLGWFLLKVAALVARVFNRFGPLRGRWTEVLARTPADLPYNAGSGHVQFFSRRAFQGLLAEAGFRVLESRNLSFLSGPFTNTLFCVSGGFCRWNVAVARQLPPAMASGWFFRCACG